MATQPAPMPIEQYLSTSYDPDVDFVDGYIEERNLGEFEHARLQALITAALLALEPTCAVTTVVEQRIQVDTHRIRICDVALLMKDSPHERVTKTPPFACIEVLSPEDRLSRARIVLSDYLRMGVKHIWLLDPMRRVAYTFDETGLRAQEGLLIAQGTDIRLDIDALFSRLDS